MVSYINNRQLHSYIGFNTQHVPQLEYVRDSIWLKERRLKMKTFLIIAYDRYDCKIETEVRAYSEKQAKFFFQREYGYSPHIVLIKQVKI